VKIKEKATTIYPRPTTGLPSWGWEVCSCQPQEVAVGWYATLEGAKEEHPNADISERPRSPRHANNNDSELI